MLDSTHVFMNLSFNNLYWFKKLGFNYPLWFAKLEILTVIAVKNFQLE